MGPNRSPVFFPPRPILNRPRGEGMRITATRRNILQVLFEAEKPLALQEIQELATRPGVESPIMPRSFA